MTARRHLNTLFVTTQGAWVHKDGECVVVNFERRELVRVPIHNLSGVVTFGNVHVSPFLMGHCANNGVALSFLTENGRFLGALRGPVSGNVLLRRQQYRLADSREASAQFAQSFILGKTANCRQVLLRANRDRTEPSPELAEAAQRMADCLVRLRANSDLDVLRGIEGEAGNVYFGVFARLFDRQGFRFEGRSRRPPLDEINCLLSFVYTLLMHDVRSALETVGLDPAAGFLHRDRPGRPSLALDMMEEFRPFVADRLVLSLVNRGQLSPKGFKRMDGGAVLMDDETRKEVLVAYQKRKQEELVHPFVEERMSVGMLWHVQARLLSRCIRGEMEQYPPFLWR